MTIKMIIFMKLIELVIFGHYRLIICHNAATFLKFSTEPY